MSLFLFLRQDWPAVFDTAATAALFVLVPAFNLFNGALKDTVDPKER